MDEAALGATSRNPGFRVTLNPAAEGKSPGGSSGGSAAAVVSGACDVALGTDTLGSVRIPAAYCGVYGLKTGRGVLPMDGVFPLAPSLDTLGLLGRTTAEICTALDALDVPEGSDIERIAVAAQSGFPHTAPCILAALDRAATALGATECDAGLDFTRIRKDAFLLTEIEGAQSLADERVSEGLRRLLDYGEALSKDTRSRIADRLATAASQVRALAGSDTVLLLPTVSEPAFPIEGAPPPGQADFTAPANVAGLPALAIPIPSDGLPISLQLVGPEGSERALLALAERLSEAF
jgi:aspartyl-tRNA(Asn)/glutamyl-tRNA(Gln) amidotransferase subunit A